MWPVLIGVALMSLAQASSPLQVQGSSVTRWNALMASGCDFSMVPAWTPVEARILRNTPYAMRGHPFRSPELVSFFQADLSQYTPQTAVTALPADQAACVSKLAAHEKTLRAAWTVSPDQEQRLTRDLSAFRYWTSISDSHRAANPYNEGQRVLEEGGVLIWEGRWGPCNPDGALEEMCGAFLLRCPEDGFCVEESTG